MQNINANRGNVVRLQARSDRQNEEPLMEKNKALDAAVAQIERAFGKGSIMRMGSRGVDEQIEVIPSGSLGLWASAVCHAAASSRSTARKAPARPRWRCMPSPRRRSAAAPAPSSTRNMRWIPAMPASSASMWTIC
jgi:hypothetical protein